VAVLLFDFCDYWLHRAGHESAVFWAAHSVHHQSQQFNFSTALRQESMVAFLGWAFYLPMAVVGVPPEQFGIAGLIVLVYQFWIHTEHIGKLGWFDRVFSSPSNHRVHHAVNDGYVDRNYGGMLVVWDRMFGTFAEENERCVYGTRKALASFDPVRAILGRMRRCCATVGTRAGGATSSRCGSSRRAGGRPMWRRVSWKRRSRSMKRCTSTIRC
jgi:alkylglycerol monooxygenase